MTFASACTRSLCSTEEKTSRDVMTRTRLSRARAKLRAKPSALRLAESIGQPGDQSGQSAVTINGHSCDLGERRQSLMPRALPGVFSTRHRKPAVRNGVRGCEVSALT